MKGQVLRKKRRQTSQVTDEKRLLEGKERISSVAAVLFLGGGYHNTSVREIAQKAGMSVGSVFNYFTSKEEILFFLFSHNQSRTEDVLREQRAEYEQLKSEGVDPKQLFLLAYQRYVRLIDELRRDVVLGYQEMKSLTSTERGRLLAGEERIQSLLEEIIAYGMQKGAFPPGDIDIKAHCLIVMAQSWAVRHWALKRFVKVDDYLQTLHLVALGVLESHTGNVNEVSALDGKANGATPQLRGVFP